MHMATALLVAVTLMQLLQPRSALTTEEFNAFRADTEHTEQNTGLQGEVELTVVSKGRRSFYRLESNGIPDHDTGIFPVPGRGNPNPIASQTHNKSIPKYPEVAKVPGCLPVGPIAFAKNGVPIFSAVNSDNEDAGLGERFDDCNGHPNKNGTYHYHLNPKCLLTGVEDEFVGVALDGFPIYGNKDCNGIISSTVLDKCHGRYEDGMYRYRLTDDYPYTIGCFKGEPMGRYRCNNDKLVGHSSGNLQYFSIT